MKIKKGVLISFCNTSIVIEIKKCKPDFSQGRYIYLKRRFQNYVINCWVSVNIKTNFMDCDDGGSKRIEDSLGVKILIRKCVLQRSRVF